MARILVIDDDKELRSVLRVALEASGHQVREAVDGARGVKLYREEPCDLILCDLVMDEKEGLQTIRELRQEPENVKIVAMSGGAFGGTMDFLPVAKKLGAIQVLKKPFDVATLLGVIRQVVQNTSSVKGAQRR